MFWAKYKWKHNLSKMSKDRNRSFTKEDTQMASEYMRRCSMFSATRKMQRQHESSPHIHQNGPGAEHSQHPMLPNTRSNRNAHSLLARLQNCSGSLEDSWPLLTLSYYAAQHSYLGVTQRSWKLICTQTCPGSYDSSIHNRQSLKETSFTKRMGR